MAERTDPIGSFYQAVNSKVRDIFIALYRDFPDPHRVTGQEKFWPTNSPGGRSRRQIVGGAAGPWIAGVSHDLTDSYAFAFLLSIVCSAFSALAIWAGGWRLAR